MTQKIFRIITLGCKVNQYESACLEKRLKDTGWSEAGSDDKADLVIINTCIVTRRASYQSRQAIRKAIRENPGCVAAAVGCYGQAFRDELTGIEGLNIITGNADKLSLPDIVEEDPHGRQICVVTNDFTKIGTFGYFPAKAPSDRTRASLKIQDGCDSFCSYCIVPFARGPVRSLEPPEVIGSLHVLSEESYREVVLTGIHLGKYGADQGNGINLKTLLAAIEREGLPVRIRLSSLEPNEIDTELIEMIASSGYLCRHLHIPLQSGDDNILKRMNRHYSTWDFARLIELIHDKIPLAAIGIDIIAGFPGEDDHAHKNTVSFISHLPVSYLHVFPYSPRKGTVAASFPDHVNQNLIKERAAQLRDLAKKKREAFHRSCIGAEFSVITKGRHPKKKDMIEGISDNYLNILFPSSRLPKNSLINVRVTEAGADEIMGVTVNELHQDIIKVQNQTETGNI
jgi:threonylcarbamoyladenosine tRNA methylthiotransferase MtaB